MPRPSRRAEVRASAARLFREHGYEATSMDLLADDVGLNKGTLYHYYPAKSAILYELLSDQMDATLELVSAVPDDASAAERLRAFIAAQVEHVSTKPDELVVFFQEVPWIDRHLAKEDAATLNSRIREYERFTRELLSDGVRSGEFRTMDETMVMFSTIGLLAYIPSWFRGRSHSSREALVTELTEFIIRGVLADA